MKNEVGLHGARRLAYVQLGMTALIALIMLRWGLVYSLSAVCGGLVSIIPHALFAQKLFTDQRVCSAQKTVMRFYQGEAYKLLISAALFAGVFLCFHVVPLVFFAVYIVLQMIIWCAPLMFRP